jgi:glycosyltransferase involved in cell wall biosynthesis
MMDNKNTELNTQQLSVRLHLTNVAGAGATQLLLSLLPSLESNLKYPVEAIYLPDRGVLSLYTTLHKGINVSMYKRVLPNIISRLFECIFLSKAFDRETPLLVLGDLPLRVCCPQTVFVQTPHLLRPKLNAISFSSLKYLISRKVFEFNLSYVNSVIVQTSIMQESFYLSYPKFTGEVHIIPQPVPNWLLGHKNLRQINPSIRKSKKLDLVYPAAEYPHKNHALLAYISNPMEFPIEKLTLTISQSSNPAPLLNWIHCSGFLSPSEMISVYSKVDGLLFLSKEESYGFPLIEAMYIGLPIVCADLPYAHCLCGNQAIYFDPNNPLSLKEALKELVCRLDNGWQPDWRDQLTDVPENWDKVAEKFLNITINS